MLKALFYIFLFLILGEFIKYLFSIPIAGNILGMMVHFEVLKAHWFPILIATVISTILTLYVTAIIQQKFEKNG